MTHALTEWLERSVTLLVGGIVAGGYPTILILMAIESSFIPLPSEVVMIPAGYAAFEGQLGFWPVVAAGTVGSVVGALFNYYLASLVGRPFLMKYGHRMFIPTHKLQHVESFFMNYGHIATFVGRLLPGVRHLISIPAGLGRMPLGRFVGYTAAGAGIWCAILTWFGYWLGSQHVFWRDGWALYKSQITTGTLAIVGSVLVGYAVVLFARRNRVSQST